MSGLNESKYWKSEYELLRKKKKAEIEQMKLNQAKMITATFELLKKLGMSDNDILNYYIERGN